MYYFSKAKYQKFAEKMRIDKERLERQKETEKERVVRLEGELKMSNREVQNLKEDKVDTLRKTLPKVAAICDFLLIGRKF